MNAQDCSVLLKSIDKSYSGECKKGKANGNGHAVGKDSYKGEFKKGYPEGNGVYTWENGSVYTGEFKKGKKEGKGTLINIEEEKQVTVKGFWKEDKYLGQYQFSSKKIDKSSNISSYTLKEASQDVNAIRFYIKENQTMVTNPQLNIVPHHGNFTSVNKGREYYELVHVTYPFKARVQYKQEYVEFELFNAGSWNVRIEITEINGLNTGN